MMMVVVLVIGLGVGFFGGMQYEKGKAPTAAGGLGANGQFRRGAGGAAGANAFRATTGTIISADAKTMTVKLADGSSKIVILSSTSTIGKYAAATSTDLTAGQTVQVFGSTNSDGSVTAQTIQLNPPQRMIPSGAPRTGAGTGTGSANY